MSSPQEMWEALPPVTRAWLSASVAATTLVSFGALDSNKLMFWPPLIWERLELWRFLGCFVFFGKFSFNFIMSMFILARFSAGYEADPIKTSAAGGTADYAFALLLMACVCLVVAWAMESVFMGPTLSFAVLYLWSKRNPEAPTSIWGFRLKGAQLPWGLMAFNVLIGGSPLNDLIGVLVGHVYYFLAEVYPLQSGRAVLSTPEWLQRMVGGAAGIRVQGAAAHPARHNWGGQGRALGQAN